MRTAPFLAFGFASKRVAEIVHWPAIEATRRPERSASLRAGGGPGGLTGSFIVFNHPTVGELSGGMKALGIVLCFAGLVIAAVSEVAIAKGRRGADR